ncbi:MAG TPA: NAD-dependent protein deacetylase [Candidatus Competibacter sp.]|nr:NAD-dependent protein deacetylase [Candidatus Competibacteraceae bacterium]HRC71732.1 NAD-dependent protein deacetylase [Candidatus Competibacter sp.]
MTSFESFKPLAALADFIERHRPLFVLTGAGCSTDSGIPDYRDANGDWKRQQPVRYQEFVKSEQCRRRYWARSLLGWPMFARARPNLTHLALARLEAGGFIHQLVTQNVDGLHQQAGSRRVIDLHGRLDAVVCLSCPYRGSRAAFQQTLTERNPAFVALAAAIAPDGDADLDGVDCSGFQIPDCPECGGTLKPAVVFFGEAVPAPRVERACQRLAEAGALLVVGSSLSVFSGYRFCKLATARGQPIAAINLGRTRADDELTLKLNVACGLALNGLLERLGMTSTVLAPTPAAP